MTVPSTIQKIIKGLIRVDMFKGGVTVDLKLWLSKEWSGKHAPTQKYKTKYPAKML